MPLSTLHHRLERLFTKAASTFKLHNIFSCSPSSLKVRVRVTVRVRVPN
jgi:hypothetical protein